MPKNRIICFTILLLLATGIALPQELLIYNGQPLSELKMQAAGWGSGTLSESKDIIYRGVSSLKLISLNYYEGGRLDFSTPLDLSSYLKNPFAFLRFRIFPTTSPVVSTFPGAGGLCPVEHLDWEECSLPLPVHPEGCPAVPREWGVAHLECLAVSRGCPVASRGCPVAYNFPEEHTLQSIN